MFDRYFEEYLRFFPSMASFLGDRTSDDKVEVSISPTFRKKWEAVVHKYSKRLRRGSNGIDDMLLRYSLREEINGFKYPFDLMPITSFVNPALEFTFLERTMYPPNPGKSKKRHECYIRYFRQCMRNMREGVTRGYTIPRRICEKVIDDIANFVALKEYVTDPRMVSYFEKRYRPVLERLLRFLKEEYLGSCRDTIGLSNLPNGKSMYKYLVHANTTLDLSPHEVHSLGLREVKRILKEFEGLIPQNMKHLGVAGFINAVKGNPKNYIQTPKEAMTLFKTKQQELRETIVSKYFYDQVTPYEIRRTPRMLESSSAGAFYYPGCGDRPGRFFINLRDTKETPRFTVETLSIHEGEPGHHYQYQYMTDKGLPKHRVFGTEGIAFSEGWALYAESLSQSKDTMTIFGRLTYEMFRAVRCVVDTGIHYYGWSFDRALSYMKENIAAADTELISEITRYICIPGQATAYKVGEQFFREQRKEYLRKNPSLSIKDYHKAVLENGVMPLKVLEKVLRMPRS